jgi:hypothetical protein
VTDIDDVRRLVGQDHGLAVVAVSRQDGTVGSSVVNAGVIEHPVSGEQVLAFVSGAQSRRLDRLRSGRPVTFRSAWNWVSVEGRAEIIGPDDPHPQVHAAGLSGLLRDIFASAGGTHEDWAAYDAAMAEEQRAAVLIQPDRIYSNPSTP